MLTVTNTSLLIGLRDRNNEVVWTQFLNRYQPIVISFARKLGLGEQEARKVAQEALLAFVSMFREGGYEPEKGQLRTWLFGIAAQKIRERGNGSASEMAVPNDEQLSRLWDAEWQESLLTQCLEEVRRQVKSQTMRAFELCAIQGQPAEKVAAELGMTENAVWIAKNRVATRMREVQKELEENW